MNKICTKCDTLKSQNEFYPCLKNKDGLQYKCIICDNISQKTRYVKNKEKVLKKCEEYRNKTNPTYQKNYRLNNKNNRRIYENKNRDLIREINSNYRAKKLKATPKWLSKEHRKSIRLIYKNCPFGYEVDHILPLQGKTVSGLHVPWNLQYLTIRQNRSKNNRINL